MKTTKQIADELGIDKQRVYRYIKKNCINEALQKNRVKYYDDAAETVIKQGFLEKTTSSEVLHEVHQKCISDTVIDTLLMQSEMLKKELEIKNKQIEELAERLSENQKLLDQEQQLHAMTKQNLTEAGTAQLLIEDREKQLSESRKQIEEERRRTAEERKRADKAQAEILRLKGRSLWERIRNN